MELCGTLCAWGLNMNESEIYPTQFNKKVMSKDMEVVPTSQNLPPSVDRFRLQNPFNVEQYGGIPIPDTPLQVSGGMVDALLSDKNVPEDILQPFWYAFSRDLVLSFVDQERKDALMLSLDIIKIDELNSIPYYDYTFEAEKRWNIIRNVYEMKLNRSFGFKSPNVKNERILLQSQFTEARQISEDNSNRGQESFFKRLLGRR